MFDSVQQYQALFDGMTQGILIVAADGTPVEANAAALEILGVERDLLMAHPFAHPHWRLVTPEGAEIPPEQHPSSRAFSARSSQVVTVGIYNQRRQSLVWVDLSAVPLFSKGDHLPCRVCITLHDVTKHKERQESIGGNTAHGFPDQADAGLRILLDSIPNVAVQGYGPDGTVHYWNKANEAVYGYTPEEALGRNLVELIIPPEMREEVSCGIRRGAESGVMPPAAELLLMRKDGSRVPVFSSHAVLRIPGRPTEMYCIDVDFTERRKVEEALRSSERRYEMIVQTQAEFVVRYSRGGGLTFVNDTFCSYMQKPREELLAKSFYPLFFMPDREAMIRTVESMNAGNEAQVMEVRAWLPDGRLVWQKWSNSPILNDQREVVEYQATGMDITRSKQAEESLRKSEERYRSLFDNMLNGFAYCRMILDAKLPLDFVYLEVNQSFERLTGLRGVNGKRMSEVLPGVEETDPELLAAFRRVALSGQPEQLEHFMAAINEWLAISVYSPEAGCFVAVFDVITKRKRTEESLAFLAQATSNVPQQEDFFHRLARYLAEALDMDFIRIGILEEGNLWARTVAVYSDGVFEDNIRYTLKDTPCGEVVDRTVCCYRDGVRALFPRDGALQEMAAESYVGSVLWGSSGVPIGLIAAIGRKPLANRELAEEILQIVSGRAAAELERGMHVDERRRLELQLLHAQKLESLGILAGGIAHDFNNILTGILGNSSLGLLRIAPDSPAVENLQHIEKAAVRAADLAKQMLAYSGKGMFVVEPINLNHLLDDMVHLLKISVSKKAQLQLDLAPGLPPVHADPTQLRQIVMNLVINASEAIGDQGGVIAISTGFGHFDQQYLKETWFDGDVSEGDYIFLQVSDTGCGMGESTLARIFDPFFTTKFTGRGLGMSAVLGIIRGHKGAIKVQSHPGRGTTFTILLPATDLPIPVREEHKSEEGWRGSGTLLLVDDEETICEVGASMLGQLGYQVLTAVSGERALELYRSRKDIELVILDLTMPVMDGEQTFLALKELDPDVKVVMSSGYSEQEVTGRFSALGLLDFIQKPYSMQALLEVMRRCHKPPRVAGHAE